MLDTQILNRANAGDLEAQFLVGEYYESKENGELNYVEAAKWFNKAANAGHSKAQNRLANILKIGKDGVNQDIERAIHLYTESAKQGNPAAQYNLAREYDKGIIIEQDYEKAMLWYTKAAEQGDADAYYYLGNGHFWGEGFPQNHEKGVQMWHRASELGNSDAMFMLAESYRLGNGIQQDESKAFYWHRKSAEKGNDDGMFGLGLCYFNGLGTDKNYTDAYFWFTKSAEKDNLATYFYLGQLCELGLGTSVDYDAAINYYKRVPECDHAFAFRRIGNILVEQGKHPESWGWYLKARELGDEEAKRALAQESFACIIRGEQEKFAEWADKASEDGSESAMFLAATSLATCGDANINLDGDCDKAIEYLFKSKKWYERLYENDSNSKELQDNCNNINNSLGDAFLRLGRYVDAIYHYRLSDKVNATIKLGQLTIKKSLGNWDAESERVQIFSRHINLLSGQNVKQRLETNSPGYTEDAYRFFSAQLYYNLGGMYQWGIGTRQDTNEAYNCFLQASNLGADSATEMLAQYKKTSFGSYEFSG